MPRAGGQCTIAGRHCVLESAECSMRSAGACGEHVSEANGYEV